ncbi:helix-turn-helix domain-containing protein [Thalassobacillus sp. C254]|uniref:helix-turn-helix domain-containing protein n=1 Tax=Thalassobacillus sp. C254 TaxID=1225341 RepID=UPI0006CF8243|nr:helix-turn-helix domain-containing protein [Thalassobacillus sp. C254]
MKEYYTAKDVAELFDVSIDTVEKWAKEGRLKDETVTVFPKEQFDSVGKMHAIDPTFKERREYDLNEIVRSRDSKVMAALKEYLKNNPPTEKEDPIYREYEKMRKVQKRKW